jgi:DNA polymerase
MFIGQSPGATEVEQGAPFVGPSGELLDWMLDQAGLNRSQVYITNALKCRPPGNRAGHIEELAMCNKTWLRKELKKVAPSLVVLVGKDAWKSVTKGNIPFEHGKVTKTKKRKYLTIYHPGYYLRRGDIEGFVNVGNILRKALDE